MKMSFLNVKSEMLKLSKSVQNKHVEYVRQKANDLKQDLASKTPVDTGKARDSWMVKATPKGADVVNTVDYIEKLNAGSSQQAPAFFIEQTALKYGTPKGVIVEPLDGSAQG
jgi:hypothetical protein